MPIYIEEGADMPSWELLDYEEIKNYKIGYPAPSFSPFRMILRDFNDFPGYSNYKIKYHINQGSPVEWLSLTGYLVDQANHTLGIVRSYTPRSYTPVANVGQLSPGRYDAEIVFELCGISGGEEFVLESKRYFVSLIVEGNGSAVMVDKNQYNVMYVKSSGELYGDKKISVTNNIAGEILQVIFQQTSERLKTNPVTFSDFTEIIKGSAAGTMTQEAAPYYIPAILKNATNNLANFLVIVTVLDSDGISVDVSELVFSLIRSEGTTASKVVKLSNPTNKTYSVAVPSWLTYSIEKHDGYDNITFTTLNGSVINEGDYKDSISITSGAQVLTLSASLSVISFLSSEFQNNEINFCLDRKLLKFSRINSDAKFVRLKINSVFEERTISVEMSSAYFNGVCEFDIGKKIHNYFPRVNQNILSQVVVGLYRENFWYKPAIVSIEAVEIDSNYNELHIEQISNLKFYPGKKPKGFPFLTNHLVRSRLEGSFQIISYVSGKVQPADISGNISNLEKAEDGAAVAVVLSDENALVNFPAVAEFTAQNKKLLIFTRIPRPRNITLQWENQNLVPEYLNLSGEYKKTKAKSHIYDKKLENGLQKFDVENTVQFNIDTGFILKAEKSLIDEAADARIIFFSIEGNNYRGFVTNDKIVEVDSAEELIRYDLEIIAEEI